MLTESDRRVLVTGAAGFIGSHLSEALVAREAKVTGIDDLSTGKRENVAHLLSNPLFTFHQDSVMNTRLLEDIMAEGVIVFHLASAVGVKKILEETINSIETMILGTEGVLRVAAKYGSKVLIVSSSEVYGKTERTPFRESDDVVLGPPSKSRWSYAASKMIDEFLALAYHREKNLLVVIVRLFNTVGPRQTGQYGMVVPQFVDKALRGEPLLVHGDGEQTRCFCDVRDVVEAILRLAEEPKAVGHIVNIGSTERISINELARQIIRLTACTAGTNGSRISHIPYSEAYPNGFEDIRHREPDVSKVRALVGWQATTSLDEALLRVIEESSKRSRE